MICYRFTGAFVEPTSKQCYYLNHIKTLAAQSMHQPEPIELQNLHLTDYPLKPLRLHSKASASSKCFHCTNSVDGSIWVQGFMSNAIEPPINPIPIM
jgi:hypothetical protein